MVHGNREPPKKGTCRGGGCRTWKYASRHAMFIPGMAPWESPQGSPPCPCLEAVPHCVGLPGKLCAGGAFGWRLFSTENSAKKSPVPHRQAQD